MNTKQIFFILCMAIAITMLFYLDFYYLQLEHTFIGAIRELLLIPASMSIPFLTLLLGVRWYANKDIYRRYAIIGTCIGAVAAIALVYTMSVGR